MEHPQQSAKISKYTQWEFDNALKNVLTEQVYNAIPGSPGNRTKLLTMAISVIFYNDYEHNPDFKNECKILRDCGLALQANGYFMFKE